MDERSSDLSLLCRVHERLCALPLRYVLETLRPLPIDAVAGAPDYVLGLSLIRGEPLPVLDLARLLGHADARPARFVLLAVDGRRIAVAVSQVLGLRRLDAASLHALPALLSGAPSQWLAALAELDAELLLVLDGARLLPAEFLPEPAP